MTVKAFKSHSSQIYSLALALILCASVTTYANPDETVETGTQQSLCETDLGTKPALSPEEQAQRRAWEADFDRMAKNWKDGWTTRGYFGTYPPLNATTYSMAVERGIMWWNLRIYLASSEDEAKAHNAQLNPLVRGIYLVGSKADLQLEPTNNSNIEKPTPDSVMKMVRKGAFEINDATGELVRISEDQFKQQVDLSELLMFKADSAAQGKDFMVTPGWAATKLRGVWSYDENYQKSEKIKKARQLARVLVKDGYRFTVNENFQESLNLARDQIREGGVVSRYHDKKFYDMAMEMYREHHAFSVELRDPSGKLLVGTINYKVGNLVVGDTVFEISKEEQASEPIFQRKDPIDLIRAVDILTFDDMASKGIKVMDVGMVSNYSATLGAKLVPRQEFLDKLFIHPEVPAQTVDLDAELDPFTAAQDNYGQVFNEMFKKRNAGAAMVGFLATVPYVNPQSEIVAATKGIFSWGARVFVQPSIEKAWEHAKVVAEHYDNDNMMQGLYLIGEAKDELTPDGSAFNTMTAAVKEGLYFFPNPLESKKYRYFSPDQLKNVIIPTSDTNRMSWQNNIPGIGYRVILSGWVYPKKRGVLMFKDAFQKSKAKKLIKQFRGKFGPDGFQVKFNSNFIALLDGLKNEVRKGQTQEMNRYNDEETYQTSLNRLRQGTALALEIWSPEVDGQRQLVAGIYDPFVNGFHAPGTLYHKDVTIQRKEIQGGRTVEMPQTIKGIDLANYAILVLLNRLQQAGIPGVDAQMVTPNTAAMGGRYLTQPEFEKEFIPMTNEERPVNLTKPYSPDELDKAYQDANQQESN